MTFTVFNCIFYLFCLSVCLCVLCMAVWAMLPHSNKMMMMMMMMMMMTMMIMIKLLPCILYEKICSYFSTGNGQRKEPTLCQLYRQTFVPYVSYNCSSSGKLYSVFEHLDVL